MEQLTQYADLTNDYATKFFAENFCEDNVFEKAIEYSYFTGGKRIRAAFVLEFCLMFGGNIEHALPAALAVELVHAFSLIHDDLPGMDNDDIRRGQPTCHKVFGEGQAILAGDAAHTLALNIILKMDLPIEKKLKMVTIFNEAIYDMIKGQSVDIAQHRILDITDLYDLYRYKTGALFTLACRSGKICHPTSESGYLVLTRGFAANFALAFQIVDDIIDVTSGKNSDVKNEKMTYVSFFGIEKAKREAELRTKDALDYLKKLPKSEFLLNLTKSLIERTF